MGSFLTTPRGHSPKENSYSERPYCTKKQRSFSSGLINIPSHLCLVNGFFKKYYTKKCPKIKHFGTFLSEHFSATICCVLYLLIHKLSVFLYKRLCYDPDKCKQYTGDRPYDPGTIPSVRQEAERKKDNYHKKPVYSG